LIDGFMLVVSVVFSRRMLMVVFLVFFVMIVLVIRVGLVLCSCCESMRICIVLLLCVDVMLLIL